MLFEGFLNEITARGYDVHDVSGYGFRCTAGSGGWGGARGWQAGVSAAFIWSAFESEESAAEAVSEMERRGYDAYVRPTAAFSSPRTSSASPKRAR